MTRETLGSPLRDCDNIQCVGIMLSLPLLRQRLLNTRVRALVVHEICTENTCRRGPVSANGPSHITDSQKSNEAKQQ